MPVLTADGLPQAGALQVPVTEHAHGHVRGHDRTQVVQQVAEVRHPGTGLAPGLDAPGHGDGQATVDDADDQGHQFLALGVGSTASVSSVPCHQVRTQRRRGAKQACTSRGTRQGAARSAPSRSHSRRYWRVMCQPRPRLCRAPRTAFWQLLRARIVAPTYRARPLTWLGRRCGRCLAMHAACG